MSKFLKKKNFELMIPKKTYPCKVSRFITSFTHSPPAAFRVIMSSPTSHPSIDSLVEKANATVAGLVVRTASGEDGALQSVSLLEQDAGGDGDYVLFAEMKVDQNGEVEYPSDNPNEKSAFKIKLSNCETTTHKVEYEHGPRVNVTVVIDIEQMCFARILDELKKLLPADAVLFRRVVGYGVDPIYERLGFTITPHVFGENESRPRCSVNDVTLSLADWRPSPRVGDKRSAEVGDEQIAKKVKNGDVEEKNVSL